MGMDNKRTDKGRDGQMNRWTNGQIFTQYSGISSHTLSGVPIRVEGCCGLWFLHPPLPLVYPIFFCPFKYPPGSFLSIDIGCNKTLIMKSVAFNQCPIFFPKLFLFLFLFFFLQPCLHCLMAILQIEDTVTHP
jgi:hypothetical protein